MRERMGKYLISAEGVRFRFLFWGIMLWLILWSAMGVTGRTQESQIKDEAGILTQEEREELGNLADELRDKHDMNFLVLTTNDARGKSAEEYADDYYMDNGYYDNPYRGGITLLIDMDNRELWVSTAGDMRYYITDNRVEEILDAGYDLVASAEYGEAFSAMLKKTDALIEKGIPSNQYLYDEETGRIIRHRSLTAAEICVAILVSLLIAVFACVTVYMRYGRVQKYEYSAGDNAKIKLTRHQDRLVNQFVTRRVIPRNPPSGGRGGHGGGSGRTTVHTSGGGGSFGGGGRKF